MSMTKRGKRRRSAIERRQLLYITHPNYELWESIALMMPDKTLAETTVSFMGAKSIAKRAKFLALRAACVKRWPHLANYISPAVLLKLAAQEKAESTTIGGFGVSAGTWANAGNHVFLRTGSYSSTTFTLTGGEK